MAGTKKHDRQALREELDKLGIVISPGIGGFGGGGRGGRGGGGGPGTPGQLTFSVQAKRDTLPQALTLLGEILREPAFPEAEFETSKRRMRSMQAGNTTEPGTLARNRLERILSPYGKDDIRYVPTVEESIARAESVSLHQIKSIYDTQVGATKGEMAVVGDFDPDSTLSKVKEILSGWESKVPYRRIERKSPPDRSGAKEDILTPDKANATYLAGLAFPLKETDPDFAALQVGNFILGGGTLSSRLGDRIRQKEGLSYGAVSRFTANAQDPVGSLTISVNTNPVNMERVDVAAVEELERFMADGPSLTELDDAKKAYLEAQKVGRTGDAAIAGQIVSHLNLDRTFAHEIEQEKRIAALTPLDIQAAFKKYVDPKKLVIIRAGDLKK
jgi:zinc protease